MFYSKSELGPGFKRNEINPTTLMAVIIRNCSHRSFQSIAAIHTIRYTLCVRSSSSRFCVTDNASPVVRERMCILSTVQRTHLLEFAPQAFVPILGRQKEIIVQFFNLSSLNIENDKTDDKRNAALDSNKWIKNSLATTQRGSNDVVVSLFGFFYTSFMHDMYPCCSRFTLK